MKTRKSPNSKLEKSKIIFLQIGLILVLSVVFLAFEIKTPMIINKITLGDMRNGDIEELPPIIKEKKPEIKPEKPKPALDFKKADNDKKDVKEVEIHNAEGNIDTPVVHDNVKLKDEKNVDDFDAPVTVAEKMPEYPGGLKAMYAYLSGNLKTTQQAIDFGIEGKVFVTFVVEKDGSITGIEIMRGLGFGLDEEVVRVLQSMPPWSPGMQGGKKVRVQYNLPVSFKIR